MKPIIKRLPCQRWRLEYRRGGQRIRQRFETKQKAEAALATAMAETQAGHFAWSNMKDSDRNELMFVVGEMAKVGKTAREVWEAYRLGSKTFSSPVTLREAFRRFMDEKEAHRLSHSALAAYRSNVGRFIRGREETKVVMLRREDVALWLSAYADQTFNTYLTSLKSFLGWCAQSEIISVSPAATIRKIERRRMSSYDMAPRALTGDELRALLGAALRVDRPLARYVALCCLAGLRPEREAANVRPTDINEQIHVRGLHAKDRQDRYIEILPALAQWLALPLEEPFHGPAVASFPIRNLRRRFERVRLESGLMTKEDGELKGWTQDIMRHTFASAYMTMFGADKAKEALGHGDYSMLFQHYRKSITKAEAEALLSVSPAMCQPHR